MERPPASFDWDDANREKCRKHGVSIAEIEHVLGHAETYLVPDIRNSKFEPRFIAVGRNVGGRFMFVIFTLRRKHDQTLWRRISARYMHKKEIARYEKEISGTQDRSRS
jgi:uncharacterized protein